MGAKTARAARDSLQPAAAILSERSEDFSRGAPAATILCTKKQAAAPESATAVCFLCAGVYSATLKITMRFQLFSSYTCLSLPSATMLRREAGMPYSPVSMS